MISEPVRVLEELAVYTPLGIRFWDPVEDRQIRTGLEVTLWPTTTASPLVRAYRTRSDIYAFNGIPGLREQEYPSGDDPAPVGSPPQQRPFVLQVEDNRGRFLPVARQLQLPLPYRGLFPRSPADSPSRATAPGFLLYSAPTRPWPTWLAAVRGELWDFDADRPAAHARLQLRVDGRHRGTGLSDDQGRFAVYLPYPALDEPAGASPPPLGQGSLFDQSWPVELTVFYQPGLRQPLTGTPLPDYLSVLSQEAADIWQQAPEDSGPDATWLGTLRYGEELIATTAGLPLPQLLVRPAQFSP
ncbi:MAG: hypothetical protein R3310_12365 [Candidatus Competibacteraceae bacterium]|nr:hypothetical protein [Candidatus Competibacteraceae bacterium]